MMMALTLNLSRQLKFLKENEAKMCIYGTDTDRGMLCAQGGRHYSLQPSFLGTT